MCTRVCVLLFTGTFISTIYIWYSLTFFINLQCYLLITNKYNNGGPVHCKRIAPYEKCLLKPQNTVQAPYTHRTNTVQALHKQRTVRCFLGLCKRFSFFSKIHSYAPTLQNLFFFKNCSSQFRNWYVFTYFSSTYMLYCVVRYTVLLYVMFCTILSSSTFLFHIFHFH